MIFGILAVIILGIFGFLEWVIGTLSLMFLDGLFCTIIDWCNYEPNKLYSEEYKFHSGIFTDYISVDISIAWLIWVIIYKLYKKVNA